MHHTYIRKMLPITGGMKIGIVGLPNVGKTTLFNALTQNQAKVANFPFTTINPNIGVVEVPDERLNKIFEITKSQKVTPVTIEFVDIAGLVSGAHLGEGLGNRFLSHIQEVDAILLVVRIFQNPEVSFTTFATDPEKEMNIILRELIMADLRMVENRLEKLKKAKGETDKFLAQEIEFLSALSKRLNEGKPAQKIEINNDERKFLNNFHLLTAKPMIYLLNADEEQLKNNSWQNYLKDKHPRLALCAKFEAEMSELKKEEQTDEWESMRSSESSLNQLISLCYKSLNLITFYTFNQKETRAWAVKFGTIAKEAAGKVHTDFEKGFIRADVINWEDFIRCGSLIRSKEMGLIRSEGKEYVIKDGDICYFHSR